MSESHFSIRPLDKSATPAEFAALNGHINAIRKEHLPDDPPMPVEETTANIQSLPSFVDLRMWNVWDGECILASGHVVFIHMGANLHLAQFDISVLPEYRRQGLGKELLSLVVQAMQGEGRRTLMTSTVDRIPAGEAFMIRMGSKRGLETHTNQLRLSDLDRDLLQRWLEQGRQNLSEFTLGFWDGPYPEDQLQQICQLQDVTNQQPFGDLEIEDVHITPEQIREIETNIFARGSQRWTFYLVDRLTGSFAGYTETVWNPNRPALLRQDMTGVFPQYRGKGLGRWLKAAMLDKVLRDRPEVQLVRTGNADSNAPMLKINTQLGFKPYTADTLWQVEVPQVVEYLSKP
jgi:GNAT superfamily N-acetyltransferase